MERRIMFALTLALAAFALSAYVTRQEYASDACQVRYTDRVSALAPRFGGGQCVRRATYWWNR